MKKLDAPKDLEFEVGMINTRLDSPHMKLPEAKDRLFVTKPLMSYEPVHQDDEVKKFDPDPNERVKKKFPSEPNNHAEIRDISQTLSGDQLQKVFAGPVYIDFGSVHVKSKMTKTFFVRNDLRTAISVRIIVDRDELKETYQKQQIIPSSQLAGFEVTICSLNLGSFRTNCKYIINERHLFEFQVIASIELVRLELAKTNLKMLFTEENIEMSTSEMVRVTNSGNGPGKFRWVFTQ